MWRSLTCTTHATSPSMGKADLATAPSSSAAVHGAESGRMKRRRGSMRGCEILDAIAGKLLPPVEDPAGIGAAGDRANDAVILQGKKRCRDTVACYVVSKRLVLVQRGRDSSVFCFPKI